MRPNAPRTYGTCGCVRVQPLAWDIAADGQGKCENAVITFSAAAQVCPQLKQSCDAGRGTVNLKGHDKLHQAQRTWSRSKQEASLGVDCGTCACLGGMYSMKLV